MTQADATGSGPLADWTASLDAADRLRVVLFATGLAIGGYFVGNVFAAALYVVVTSAGAALPVPLPSDDALRVFLSTIGIQGLGFGGTAFYVLTRFDLGREFVRVRRPTLRTVAAIVGGFVLFLGLYLGLVQLYAALGIETGGSSIVSSAVQNPLLGVALILLSLVLVGPAEELLYRGIVQTTFARALGAPAAVLATSAAFASIHYFGVTGSVEARLATVSLVFALAVFLGAVYELTDNLVVPAVIHGLYNATTFAVALFGVPGA